MTAYRCKNCKATFVDSVACSECGSLMSTKIDDEIVTTLRADLAARDEEVERWKRIASRVELERESVQADLAARDETIAGLRAERDDDARSNCLRDTDGEPVCGECLNYVMHDDLRKVTCPDCLWRRVVEALRDLSAANTTIGDVEKRWQEATAEGTVLREALQEARDRAACNVPHFQITQSIAAALGNAPSAARALLATLADKDGRIRELEAERSDYLRAKAEDERITAEAAYDLRQSAIRAIALENSITAAEARADKAEAALTDAAAEWCEDGDKALPEDEAIDAAFPTRTGLHGLYVEALRLVGARQSKGGLVDLVNWLLSRTSAAEAALVTERAARERAEGALRQPKRMTSSAFEKLIAEDRAWLATTPRTLEREHIDALLSVAVAHEYEGAVAAEARAATAERERDEANATCANATTNCVRANALALEADDGRCAAERAAEAMRAALVPFADWAASPIFGGADDLEAIVENERPIVGDLRRARAALTAATPAASTLGQEILALIEGLDADKNIGPANALRALHDRHWGTR